MKTITEKLADALRLAEANATLTPCESAQVYAALAAYDAQQAQQARPVAAGAWVAEPITNVVSAPPLPRRAYREPVATCNSAEYAARIVACVNACQGMTLAEIESFGAPGELGRCARLWASDDGEEVTP